MVPNPRLAPNMAWLSENAGALADSTRIIAVRDSTLVGSSANDWANRGAKATPRAANPTETIPVAANAVRVSGEDGALALVGPQPGDEKREASIRRRGGPRWRPV